METIGEKYFDILVNYSFLQEVNKGYQDRYRMHDLVHDLATYISKKDLLVWKEEVELDDAPQIRHLVFGSWQVFDKAPQNLVVMRKLRTINFRFSVPGLDALIYARYLRTLIMSSVNLSEVPSVIGDLVHLRYLDLSYNYRIEVLPDSICKLYQLQTLRLLNCSLLKELPRELYKLVNLRHIYAQELLLASPRGLRQLTSLQTLPHLVLSDGTGWTVDELKLLNQIKGNLFIRGLEYVKAIEEARKVSLSIKDKLLELDLGWSLERQENNFARADEGDVLVLDSFEPHPNLKSLRISGFMGVNFPCWVLKMAVKHCGYTTTLINLTEITLSECRRCQQLPTFGQLPFLSVLRLENFHEVQCIGNEFYESTSKRTTILKEKVLFASLKRLHIKCFWKVTTWMSPSPTLAATAFPSLETLEIHDCPELEMIPTFDLPSLRCLEIVDVGATQPLDVVKHSHGLTSVTVMLMENITSLPQEWSNYTNLRELEISCDNLTTMPTGLISMKQLRVHGCSSLTCIPDDAFHGLSYLWHLEISECSILKKIPTSLGECTSLEFLHINDCPLLEGPLPNLGKLQSLDELYLINSGEFTRSSAQWLSHLPRLSALQIGGFEDEDKLRQFLTTPALDLKSNQILKHIELRNCPKVTLLPQELQMLLPANLQSLYIFGFGELEGLPDWIGDLSSLRALSLRNCKELKFLPSKEAMMRLSNLLRLTIMQCPILEERCAKTYGLDLVKISHIPVRFISGKHCYRDF